MMIIPGFPTPILGGKKLITYGPITMTAGNPSGYGGYIDGVGGSISGQPVPGVTLNSLIAAGGQLTLAFAGDARFLVTLYVNGVPYALGAGEYSSGNTQFTILSGGPTFTNGVNYQIGFA